MSLEPEAFETTPAAKDRTTLPGVFLIIVGILNVLGSLYFVGNVVLAVVQPPQRTWQSMEEMMPGYVEQMKEQGWTPEQFRNVSIGINSTLSIIMLVAAVITILAGVKMITLRAYALAVTGAVLAAIPCVSCLGCCGVGEAVGIWALVVLLSPEVKDAFR